MASGASKKLEQSAEIISDSDESGSFIIIRQDQTSNLTVVREKIIVKNKHLYGFNVVRVENKINLGSTNEGGIGNVPIAYVSPGYAPLVARYYTAYITPGLWSTNAEEAKLFYINKNRQIIMYWSNPAGIINAGKYICLMYDYDY